MHHQIEINTRRLDLLSLTADMTRLTALVASFESRGSDYWTVSLFERSSNAYRNAVKTRKLLRQTEAVRDLIVRRLAAICDLDGVPFRTHHGVGNGDSRLFPS